MHSHDHTPITVTEAAPGYYEVMETSIRELLTEKGIIQPAEIRRQIEVLEQVFYPFRPAAILTLSQPE